MNVLITGVAGFIGFSFANKILKKKNIKVLGLDNFDNYYSVSLKKKRILILKKNKNFSFKNIDIQNYNKLINFVKKNKIDYIFHFAAQAGVRYVLIDPKKYIDVNISGFFNILKIVLIAKPKKFFYASSSSVYGDQAKYPSAENQNLKPKNVYGLSKKINEDLVSLYCKNTRTQFIGLRFFTVYGEWGRPDMLLIKFMIFAAKKLIFKVHNYGNHIRDFTYIKDVTNILETLLFSNKLKNNLILNICSSRPLKLNFVMKKIRDITKFNLITSSPFNKEEVIKTYGSNKELLKIIKEFKFTNFNEGLKNTYTWFLKNKKYII
jgi:UDP-glucuronate 4-epimerase